jgi:hypothetical protein
MAAWTSYTVKDFMALDGEPVSAVLAGMAAERGFSSTPATMSAWAETVGVVREALHRLSSSASIDGWGLLFEYEIPRRGLRPDVVLLAGSEIAVIEFKAGADRYDRAALMQVTEYAQDLRDFHHESAGRQATPILVATGAHGDPRSLPVEGSSTHVECVNDAGQLAEVLAKLAAAGGEQISLEDWDGSAYQPTPDILTAAREVFGGHNIRDITFAYADNLDATVDTIRGAIALARQESLHVVVFVTGVPGSGKTLAGLSAVHDMAGDEQRGASDPLGAYLSGNGPLVNVLQYALAKDLRTRESLTETEAKRRAKTFVQPVHLYIREYSDEAATPSDHVIVFDEAQRAWDARQMMRKQSIDRSEAEVILDAMSRVPPWAVLVGLVGEGQEINSGEAGLGEWSRALEVRQEWHVLAAPDVAPRFSSLAGRLATDDTLHLTVNVRAPRARAIAGWADALVSGNFERARELIAQHSEYPVLLTRSLEEMRSYLRDRIATDRRVGLLASSQARRLRPFGIEMSSSFQGGVDWPRWFVDDAEDIRSSFSLEIAASEFKCQGLEIDWAGLCWGDDFFWSSDKGTWVARRLRGSSWTVDSDMTYARNRYRVLLTRARYGLVIWVPRPLGHELLVDPELLDATAAALMEAGARPLAGVDGEALDESPSSGREPVKGSHAY